MPINERKVLAILLEEVDKVPERCDGYGDQLKNAIAEIVTAEREHRTRRGQIQQWVDDICDDAGDWLAKRQP